MLENIGADVGETTTCNNFAADNWESFHKCTEFDLYRYWSVGSNLVLAALCNNGLFDK